MVSALDNATAGEVESVLTSPPRDNKYDAIKTALLTAFAKTQAQKDAELLGLTGLGDMKPTALLRKMRSFNSDTATLFRAHFLALLPTEVRSVLASREIKELDELAQTADRIVEARGSSGHVAPVSGPAPRKQGGPNRQEGDKVCHYHVRFGNKARNCKPWCILNPQP